MQKEKKEVWAVKVPRGFQDQQERQGFKAVWEAKEIKENLAFWEKREPLVFQVLEA